MEEFSCTDINGVSVSQFVFNDDGTVSGIIPTGSTTDDGSSETTYTELSGGYTKTLGTTESPISQECCNSLNFNWESSTNTCYWSETCETTPEFKVVMGAQGNEGAFFQVDDNETCQLKIKFEYLFQFDCETLRECTLTSINTSGEFGDVIKEIEEIEEEILTYDDAIISLSNQRDETNIAWNEAIHQTNTEIEKQKQTVDNINEEFIKTKLSKERTVDESEKELLNKREMVLTDSFDKNNSKLTDLENKRNEQVRLKENQINNDSQKIEEYKVVKNKLETSLIPLKEEADILILNTESTNDYGSNCLSVFENLDVAVTLDKVVDRESDSQISYENNQILENIHTSNLFKIDDIVEYFDGNCNTGLYVTGSTSCMNQIKECISYSLGDDCDVLSACTLNSDWLTYEFEITDLETLSKITNEEIKLGFLVRNNDCDFNILIDRIEINKSCTEIDKNDVYISKCPSFELQRVCDNKKSWVATDKKQEREYFTKGRETDYDVNHHKSIINTKEIDLEISPATAIENNVWHYLNDNIDLLNCSTGYTSINIRTDIDFNDILTAQTHNCNTNAIDNSCLVYSTWGINVELECNNIYSNPNFFTGVTIDDYPTQQDYINELENISNSLGLLFTSGTSEVIFTDIVNCSGTTYINNNFKIDLQLDLSIDCENKLF